MHTSSILNAVKRSMYFGDTLQSKYSVIFFCFQNGRMFQHQSVWSLVYIFKYAIVNISDLDRSANILMHDTFTYVKRKFSINA